MSFPECLKIAVIPLQHNWDLKKYENGSIEATGGLEKNIIDILSSKFGFDYELHLPKDRAWGKWVNGSWTGMIGAVQRNETDLALGDLTITDRRMEAVDFAPYAVESSTFVTKLPKTLLKPTSFLKPFQWQIWLIFFFNLIFLPFLFRILMKKKIPVLKLAFNIFGSVLSQPITFNVECGSDKLLIGSWIVSGVLISYSYTALLLSSLTVPIHENGVRTIKDLASAASQNKYKVMTNRGSSNIDMLRNSVNEDLRLLKKYIVEERWLSENEEVIAPVEIEENVAILGSRWFFLLQYGEPPFTNKYVFKETVSVGNIGLAINKQFCCKNNLSNALTWIVDTGILRKLYNYEFFKARWRLMLSGNSMDLGPRPLSMSDMLGPFVLLGGGYLLGLLICLFGIIKCKLTQDRYKVTVPNL